MTTTYKFLFLYLIFILLMIFSILGIDFLKNRNVEIQKNILFKQAQTHFNQQVNTRAWSANFGGVYVFPKNGIKPNPYLINNTLKTAQGETLIKINPAWMTRQLSELSKTKGFHFRITSLLPLNPNNKANLFEKRALEYFEKTKDTQYSEIQKGSDYRYMGALVTTQNCLLCHAHQGYEVGDIRGGISIRINGEHYHEVVAELNSRSLYIKLIILFLLLSILLLLHRQIINTKSLEEKVFKKTKEIENTKVLLQEVLDTDKSFLMVADGEDIILSNKTMLDFFKVKSLEVFRKKYKYISEAFIEQEDENFLSKYINNEHWIKYLNREQDAKDLKVVLKRENEERYFKVHSKEIVVENKKLSIIIFDDITDSLQKITFLEEKASRDVLTGLFNRGKFNDVLIQEIALSKVSLSPLSIIFLDIDHFKIVNDTYGHDIGDYVLIELSNILQSIVRKSDFVGRWGGEEFVITLQSTTIDEAFTLAEKIRVKVENYDFESGGKQAISLGVTQYQNNDDETSLLKRVDEALYEAKNTGRNKSVIR